MLAALAIIATTSLIDLLLTLKCMHGIGMFESNPLVRVLAASAAPDATITLLKSASVLFAVIIFWRLRAHRSAEIGAWVGVAIHIALMLHWGMYASWMSGLSPSELQSLSGELTRIS
jgi:hypothetical protein